MILYPSTGTGSETVPAERVSLPSNPYRKTGFIDCSWPEAFHGVLHPVQSAPIQDVGVAPDMDEDLGYPIVPNVHGNDQGIIV